MKRYCEKCKKEYPEDVKKCPVCGSKLKKVLTEEEEKEIQKQNDDFTVINTMLM